MDVIRAFATALFVLSLGAPAAAQKPDPPPARLAETLGPEHVAAALDFYRSIVFDTGMVETLSNGIGAEIMPSIRTSMLDSDLYRSVSEERQAALRAYVETLPQVMLEECEAMFTELGRRAAPRFAERLSGEHLSEIAAFMRTPDMRDAWRTMMKAYLEGRDDAMTGMLPWSMEAPATRAFAETEAGRALGREIDSINRILEEEMEASLTLAMPRIQTRIFEGMCAALGDECPDDLRRQVNRI